MNKTNNTDNKYDKVMIVNNEYMTKEQINWFKNIEKLNNENKLKCELRMKEIELRKQYAIKNHNTSKNNNYITKILNYFVKKLFKLSNK